MPRIRPYDFQEADVQAALANNGNAVIVAETGAGKTVIGAELARRTGAPVKLIIATGGTHDDVWRATITGHLDDDEESDTFGQWIEGLDPEAQVRTVEGTDPGKKAMDDMEWGVPGYYLMTHQVFTRWKPLHLRPDFMLVDEVHLIGSRHAKGGQLLMQFGGKAGARTAMSGTVARNLFENVWTVARFVEPGLNDRGQLADIAPNRWISNFCETEYDPHAPGNIKVVGELNPGEVASLFPCWRQHFKREHCCEFHPKGFLANLPAPVVIRRHVELLPVQKTMMTQMQRDYLAYLDQDTETWKALPIEQRKKRALVTKLPIVRTTRLSQMTLAVPSIIPKPWKPKRVVDLPLKGLTEMADNGWILADDGETKQAVDKYGMPLWDVVFAADAESPKYEEMVACWHEVGEPMVAATNSKKFAEYAVNRAVREGIRAFEWSSAASEKQRAEAKAAFKRGEIDIVIGVTEAIGTGIDGLQDASGVLLSLNKSRDLTSEVQLEGRLDRRGQKRKAGVIHFELIAIGSTDEGIIDSQLERRLKLNRSLRREVAKTRSA